MLHLYDKNKRKIVGLVSYEDYCIEHELDSADKVLSFLIPRKDKTIHLIQEECYIRNKNHEFVIKSIRPGENYEIKAILNLEDLEGNPFQRFESKEQTIDKALNLALVGTGWTVRQCSLKKKRTVRMTNSSSLQIVKEIKRVYRVDIVFNTLEKTIDIYEKLGSDKGAYLIDSLNLISLEIESNSYDYATRIIPIGKDELSIESINGGKNYVENYQYSSKTKTIYWIDERYTDAESLKEDAEAKLKEISKPYRAYSAEILDLARMNSIYKDILDYELGDYITLISKDYNLKEKQRIIKYIEYPEENERNSVELANATLKFEDIQKEFEETVDTVDNITTDNGTIDGSKVDSIEPEQINNFSVEIGKIVNLEVIKADIQHLKADKADIQSLNAVDAKIGTLQATKADITELNAINANIENLKVNKADITDLNATNGKINILESEVAKIGIIEGNLADIKDIINGNLSSENIQAGGITGDRLNMTTIFVQDGNILNLNADKINAGEINLNRVKIKSQDGGIEIVGATQQFKDRNNRVRIQMGQDTQGNFNFILKGEDGTTTLIDHTGIKDKAISDNLIKESMINENAVGEKAINYNSFTTGFNKDTNTNTLKATKVRLDNKNQTLEVAFNTLDSKTEGNTNILNSHVTELNIQQGKISSLIADTTIIKDGQTVKLKDEYNKTVQTVDSIKNTISSQQTIIDQNTGKINGVEIKTNELERNLNSFSSRLTNTESTVESHTTQISQAKEIANTADYKVDNLKIGVVNLLLNTDYRFNRTNYNPGWDIDKNGNSTAENWGDYNGGVSNPSQGYHSHLNLNKFDFPVYVFNCEDTNRWLGSSQLVSSKKIKPNTEYTFSLDVYKETDNAQFSSGLYYCLNGETTQKFHSGLKCIDITEKEKWIRYSWTFKTLSDLDITKRIAFYIYGYSIVGLFYCKNAKLEEGNRATEWESAPEDLEKQIVDINTEISKTNNKITGIEQSINNINLKVNEVEKITTTHTVTLNTHTNSLNAVDGKINNAKNEAINTANNKINVINEKITTNIADINILKNKISLKVEQTDIENTISKADIAGENLLDNSGYLSDLTYWKAHVGGGATANELFLDSGMYGTYKGANLKNNSLPSGSWCILYNSSLSERNFKFTVGKEYTVNGIVWVDRPCSVSLQICDGDGLNSVLSERFNFSRAGYHNVKATFEAIVTGNNNHFRFALREEGTAIFIPYVKLALGNKESGWTPSNGDLKRYTNSKITEAKAEIKLTTDSINLEVSKKVNSNAIISSINQTAEAIKIKASKIQLEGATTVGNSNGDRVHINQGDYEIINGTKTKAFFGLRKLDDDRLIPRFAMGHNGLDKYKDNYLVMQTYPKNNNPQTYSYPYLDIGYRCTKFINTEGYGDVSNVKMYGDGNIRISPIRTLEITTNFTNGVYSGDGERSVCKFGSSSSSHYDLHMDIRAIRNTYTATGLILAHYNAKDDACLVRVNCDTSGNRFFRPLTNSGNIELGSGSYKWKKVYSNGGLGYSANNYPTPDTRKNTDLLNVIDSLDFKVPPEVFNKSDSENRQLELNTYNLEKHPLKNLFLHTHEEKDEKTGVVLKSKTVDMTSLLHLALMEIQNLKREVNILKNTSSK